MHDYWERRFLAVAEQIGSWSKDPSTKCGAVLVRPDNSIASTGYNGFPRQMDDLPDLYVDREQKYDRVIHAEMNALMFCRDTVPLKGYTLYTTAPCCSRCIVHMIQAGIDNFVWPRATPEQAQRWNLKATYRYMSESGVALYEPDPI